MNDYGDTARVAATLLTSLGLGEWCRRSVRDWRRRQQVTPEQKAVEDIDANILTVAKARDELEADNSRLREEIRETNVRHAHDRAEWGRERSDLLRREASLRGEVEHLESRLRALVDELADLKTRYGIFSRRDPRDS